MQKYLFSNSVVSSPYSGLERLTLYPLADLFIWTSQFPLDTFSHVTMNTRRLCVHKFRSTTVYCQVHNFTIDCIEATCTEIRLI